MRLRKDLKENLPLKTAALIISIILWLFVTSKGQTEVSLDVPVDFINIPHRLDIVRYDIKTVNITIRGYERFIKNLGRDNIRINVDVSKAKKGEILVPIREEDIRLPSTVTVTRINPSSLKVFFEEKMVKKVSVRPIITGEPENGYFVSSIQVVPDTLMIEGVLSELRKTRYINTEPIDITGLKEDFAQEVGLDLGGKKIKPDKDMVKVVIKIKRRIR